MKRTFAAAVAVVLASAIAGGSAFAQGASALSASAPSAAEIVRSSRDRIKADTVSTRSRMVIAAKDGSATERLVDQYTSRSGGVDRTVVVFQKPASVANTRFLTIENPGKADDRWIFLPALGKVRRIAASEGSGSFMGTDLSYDDVSSADRDALADAHVLVREEGLDGRDCWVIESKPRDADYQYSKMVSWIEKSTRIALKIELYDRKGELAKLLEILRSEDKQGRMTPTVTRMTTVKAKTSTTINIEIVKYDDPIPDSVFTTKFLETGRP
jgi:hypothetical protein